MTTRRRFLINTIATLGLLGVADMVNAANIQPPSEFRGKAVFNRILAKAASQRWALLPIGELMGKIALEFKGTPYAGQTLELSTDKEICSVNLNAFDCVTFFETTLAFARMLKNGGRTPTDLLQEVAFIRYSNGDVGDFSTRLHYTSDWFANNEAKHVVKVLKDLPGSEPFTQHVDFMTQHPASYPPLVAHPNLIPLLQKHESDINARSMTFVPMKSIAAVEPLLKTGDIVAVCTNIPGLDIVHTGLIFRTDDGVAHFINASSKKSQRKVTIEPGPLSNALHWSKDLTGAMFARPLEPSKS